MLEVCIIINRAVFFIFELPNLLLLVLELKKMLRDVITISSSHIGKGLEDVGNEAVTGELMEFLEISPHVFGGLASSGVDHLVFCNVFSD